MESRLTTLESECGGSGGSSYTQVIPDDFNKFTSSYPTSFSNNSLFHYFRGDNPGNSPLGILLITNNYEYTEPLFQILKTSNHIRIRSIYLDSNTKELKLNTTTLICGNVAINNLSGLELVNSIDNTYTKLITHANDVSFIKNYTTPNNSTDIILSKNLRTCVTNGEIIFHKPGNKITDNNFLHELKLLFSTYLTNYNKVTFRQSIIDHTLINTPYCNLFKTITINQKYLTTIKTLVGDDIFFRKLQTHYLLFTTFHSLKLIYLKLQILPVNHYFNIFVQMRLIQQLQSQSVILQNYHLDL
jgi:hypothetical protein